MSLQAVTPVNLCTISTWLKSRDPGLSFYHWQLRSILLSDL